MVESRAIIFYIFFLIIFNIFVVGFNISEDNSEITKFLFVSKTISKLHESEGVFQSILKYVLIPFMLLDIIFLILGIFSVSFSILPSIVTVLLITPLGIIAVIDYVLPYIRGN